MCLILCVGTISAKKEKGVETSYRNALIFAFDKTNSVFEDENIKLEIFNQELWVTNKTKKTLFIDLSQCFLNHNGSSRPIFTKDQDEKKASKKGVATSIDEFITIAPTTGSKQNETFICNITWKTIYGSYSTTETPWEDFSDYDRRLYEVIGEMVVESQKADPEGEKCLGTVSRHFLEDESVKNIGASIAYAFNKRAEEWNTVSLSTWVSDVIFAPYYLTKPADLKKKEKKGFGIKETKPLEINVKAEQPFEFDQDKSPLIVCDWKGNFKKGTFELSYVGILKAKRTSFWENLLTYGAAAYLAQLSADYYKSIINFQGTEVDWGKMKYSPMIEFTNQRIK